MALEKITATTGRAVPVPGDDIDTDRIIPARFMKCVTFDGLGEYMFYDVRKKEDGSDTGHNLNKKQYQGASIIISGNNFGCGSSRDHAPQALAKAGFKGVIAEGFADIFLGNSTQLGMPCVTLGHEDRLQLSQWVEKNPREEITIDLDTQQIRYADKSVALGIPASNRQALMEGKWDPLQELIENQEKVEVVARSLSYV
jgi:3-isopropylmalate/(R)-2-methylmalate dehydratase small subunit